MWFVKEIERTIVMRPRTFGPKLHEAMSAQLCEEVEGTCDRNLGWIIAVVKIDEGGQGTIMDGTGAAQFQVKFSAIVYRPFPGEVVDAVVTSVNKLGFFAEAGPLLIFVSSKTFPATETFTFQSVGEPCWVSDYRIKVNSEVRVRIVGLKWEPGSTNCIGSMREDFLGAFE